MFSTDASPEAFPDTWKSSIALVLYILVRLEYIKYD